MSPRPFIHRASRYASARAALPTLGTWLIVPIAITLITWRRVLVAPAPGLDASWKAGLYMALHRGVTFGDHGVFTYGPLGFLSFPLLWYSGLGLAAFVYFVLLKAAWALALFLGARRTFASAISLVIAVLAISIRVPVAAAGPIALIALSWAVAAELPRRQTIGIAVLAGAFSAFQLLVFTHTGIVLMALTVLFVLGAPRRRWEITGYVVLGFLIALSLGWIATGQRLGDLPNYFRYVYEIVSGYAGAMSATAPGEGWQTFAALIGLAAGVWGALQTGARGDARQRWVLVAMWVTYWFLYFKEGFVRNDGGHAAAVFVILMGGLFAFRWRREHRLSALACAAALFTFALASLGDSIGTVLKPGRSVSDAIADLRVLASPARQTALMARGRALVEIQHPLESRALSLLTGHTMAVYPYEITIPWAYALDWDPAPVWQSYAAFTSALDSLDARFLSSGRAPQRILMQAAPGIDGRVLSFDQGEANRTMLCRYQQLYSGTRFAVLSRTGNRCGSTRKLASIAADWGQPVSVPTPPDRRSLIFVRIDGVTPSGLEAVKGLLFKPPVEFITLSGRVPARLVPGTAADGLPLTAGASVDYTPPFNVGVLTTTLSVTKSGQRATGGHPLTFTFYSQAYFRDARAG